MLVLREHRPGTTPAAGHPYLLKTPDDQPPAGAAEWLQLRTGCPGPNGEGIRREPGTQANTIVPLRGSAKLPAKAPSTPRPFAGLPFDGPCLGNRAGLIGLEP